MYYQIKEILTPCTAETIIKREPGAPPYVVVMDPETWGRTRDKFDMVIDMDMDPTNVLETKAIVNFDSLTGSFYVPRRSDFGGKPHRFAFALDEKGIIFIENGEFAAKAVEKIQSFSGAEALSADVVKALVKEVRITDREHMEIRWNFKDEVMKFIQG